MRISFVIPAHNEEAYIAACLRAIIACTTNRQDIEIIVVNNASTDRTKEIVATFPNVILIDEPRKGLSQARQSGFLASHGELIANIDADTQLPSDWIKTVEEIFSTQPKVVALSGPCVYYDVSRVKNILIRDYYVIGYFFYLINRFVLRVGSVLQGGNVVIRRSALESIGGFDTSFSFYGEDADIARRLFPIGQVVFTFRLPMYSSGRRLSEEGFTTMAIRYAVNYFSTIFFKRAFTKTVVSLPKKK